MTTTQACLVALLLTLTACKGEAYLATINDGDVVKVVAARRGHEWVVEKGGQRARLRLVGLYAFDPRTPETSLKTFAEKSQSFVHALKGQEVVVKLERKEPDPRGRYLAFVMQNDRDLGEALITQGLAALYTEYPFSREAAYRAADSQARQSSVGLWKDPTANERLLALRNTWAAVRERESGQEVHDPLIARAKVTP